MRIVQVVTQMEGGGAQKVAHLLHEEFMNRGYQSELWFLYVKRPTYLDKPHVRAILNGPPRNPFDYAKIAVMFMIMLFSFRPSMIMTHTYYASIIGLPLALLAGIKKRIAIQHNPVQSYPELARKIDRFMGNSVVYSNNVVVSSGVLHSMKTYPKKYISKVKIIENGVTGGRPTVEPAQVRASLGIGEQTKLLVNVGRLAEQKNQKFLLDVLSNLPKVHLLIVGAGELHEELYKYAEEIGCIDRVHFTGEVTSGDVVNYLHASNIFVFPSVYEAMPMALIEAMKQGLPVVASDIPSCRDVLSLREEQFAGILAPLNNKGEFVRAIEELLADEQLSLFYGYRAVLKSKQYSVEGMTNGYEGLYNSRNVVHN